MIPLAKKAIRIQGPGIESKRFKTVPFEANNSGVTLAEILVAVIVSDCEGLSRIEVSPTTNSQ
jgi:hypothetical protein